MTVCRHCGRYIGQLVAAQVNQPAWRCWLHTETGHSRCSGPIPGVWPGTFAEPKEETP